MLERTLTAWKDTEITNRATMTFAFNPASQFLYMKYGIYPREPTYYVEAPSKNITESKRQAHGLEFEELTSLRDGSETLRQMDEFVLGFSLEWRHEYFFEFKARCYIFKVKGDSVGYAYVNPSGRVGSMAVNSSGFTEPVLETALRLAAGQGVEKVWHWMPGSNIHAAEVAVKYRMQLDPSVFMCTKPFAKWETYLFRSAALM